MITEALLALMAAIEQNGGLINVINTSSDVPQLKLVCDKQTYEIISISCLGLINPINENKSIGLGFTIEIGDLN